MTGYRRYMAYTHKAVSPLLNQIRERIAGFTSIKPKFGLPSVSQQTNPRHLPHKLFTSFAVGAVVAVAAPYAIAAAKGAYDYHKSRKK